MQYLKRKATNNLLHARNGNDYKFLKYLKKEWALAYPAARIIQTVLLECFVKSVFY